MNLIKQRYKDITEDTFYISTKDIKTNITTKLIISRLDKKDNPLMKINAQKDKQQNIIIYQKVNSATFNYLHNWIVDHLITIKELQEEINEVKQHG